jgi:hypothetical protein
LKKGLPIFITLLICAIAYATVTNTVVRVAGTSTVAGNNCYIVHDSTTKAEVDTFSSDTVDVLEASKVILGYYYGDYTFADSANDSTVIIVLAYTAWPYSGRTGERLIFTDTIFDTNAIATIAGTLTDFHYFDADTVLGTKLYFKTIVQDSFTGTWTGLGTDTSTLNMNFHVTQRSCD